METMYQSSSLHMIQRNFMRWRISQRKLKIKKGLLKVIHTDNEILSIRHLSNQQIQDVLYCISNSNPLNLSINGYLKTQWIYVLKQEQEYRERRLNELLYSTCLNCDDKNSNLVKNLYNIILV